MLTATTVPRRSRWTAAIAVAALAITLLVTGPPTDNGSNVEAAVDGQASRYVAISPTRVLDTREPGFGFLRDRDTLSLDALTPDVLKVLNEIGVDVLDIEAIAVNLTMTEPTEPGWLRSFPTALATANNPLTSSVNNRTANENIANLSIVPVGPNGRISIQSHRQSHIVVDVQGVFERATSSRAGRFVPLETPQRATDTRLTNNPVEAETSIVVDLTEVGVPKNASAGVINLVATETQGAGFLTSHSGGAIPNSSNVNYPGGGYTRAGSAITQLNNGTVTISVQRGTTHIVVDVIGYMTGPGAEPSTAGLFVPVEPRRHYDSRSDQAPFGTAPLAPRTSRRIEITGNFGVPSNGVLGIASNLTMTNTDGPGFLVAYPREPRPDNYSSVNSVFVNHSIANHALARLENGGLSIYSHNRSDFIVDVSGYFLDGTTPAPAGPARQPTDPAMPDMNPSLPQPEVDNDFSYLFRASGSSAADAPYTRNGNKYHGWNPCNTITYAVNTERATQPQIDAMNAGIRQAEEASGIDFIYVGEVTGSLDLDDLDVTVDGVPEPVMAVIGFSDSYNTRELSGSTIGVGGIGPSSAGSPIVKANNSAPWWIVRGGFAFADITDITATTDIEATFAHELGHMLGLGHINAPNELMRPVLSSRVRYGGGDRYGLSTIGAGQCSGSAPLLATAPLGKPAGLDATYFIAD